MRNATKERPRSHSEEDDGWLQELLVDIQADVARQPSAQVIERIRARLRARLDVPERVAA